MPGSKSPDSNRVTIYLKTDEYQMLQEIGRRLFKEGYPVLELDGSVNKSGTITTLIRIASGKAQKS